MPGPADTSSESVTSAQSVLPNDAYTSQAFFELESERVFAKSWMLVGDKSEFDEPGSAHPIMVGGIPVVLVTGADGVMRGFQNVCRHRGAQLVTRPCSGNKLLTCPYHHWSYDLTGRLRSRPHYFGSNRHDTRPEPDAPGLIPVAVETWHHWVFVNVDTHAGPLSEHVAFTETLLAGYQIDDLVLLETLLFDVEANWKLVIENFWEPNHSFSIHPQLMKAGSSDKRTPVQCDGHVLHGSIEYDDDVDPEQVPGGAIPSQKGNRAMVNRSAWMVLFPNLCLTSFPGNIGVIEVQPQSATHTVERLHVYVSAEVMTSPEQARSREQAIALWRETNQQDMDALLWIQTGRRCPGFDGGALSPYWDGVVSEFARLVSSRVNAGA